MCASIEAVSKENDARFLLRQPNFLSGLETARRRGPVTPAVMVI